MSRYFSSKYAALTPYTPGEQPRQQVFVKLNTNESPFPPSPKAQAMAKAAAENLQLYSDPTCKALVETAAKYYGIEEEEILFTNGSDDILNFAFMAFCDESHPALFPEVTYGFYPVFAQLNGVPYTTIPLNEDFTINPQDYIGKNQTIFIANPNAPTGYCLPLKDIEAIVAGNPDSVVVIDEAYVDFGGESALPLINKYPNVLVVRTTSKAYSLAGLRVGWAMGNENLISALNTVKNSINSYTLDRVAIAGGAAAIADEAYFKACCDKVIATRERSIAALTELGFRCLPSSTNFIFAAPSAIAADELFVKLREKGVLVRYFKKPRINGFLRISVGTDEEMNALLAAIKEILG